MGTLADWPRRCRSWLAAIAAASMIVASACAPVGVATTGPGGPATFSGGTSATAPSSVSPRPSAPRATSAPRSALVAAPTSAAACRGAIPTALATLQGPLTQPVGPTTTATIWYVVDGDTIRLSDKEYVRLIGVDTPETKKPGTPVEPYGKEASADALALLAGRDTVTLEKDVSNTDHYGRLLRFVWIRQGSAWLQIDYALVVRGDARLDTVKPDVRYAADYAAAQAVAQSHHVGRWAIC